MKGGGRLEGTAAIFKKKKTASCLKSRINKLNLNISTGSFDISPDRSQQCLGRIGTCKKKPLQTDVTERIHA